MVLDFEAVRDEVSRYYTGKLKEHGVTSKGVDWRDEGSHVLRHQQFLYLLGDDRSASVADLGCGFGHFLGFLRAHGCCGQYTGYDIAEPMLQAARQLHGENENIRWRMAAAPDDIADYTIASGVFNVRRHFDDASWEAYIFEIIDAMAAASRRGFAFNVLSLHSDASHRRPDLYYADPGRFLNLCAAKYGRRLALLQDSGLYEFTLIVRKGP